MGRRGALFTLELAAFAGIIVPILLRVPLTRLAAWLDPATPTLHRDPGRAALLLRELDALRARMPFVRSGCLTRSYTCYRFLRRAGHDVDLVFGIGQVNGRFSGHCWVECGGQPLGELQDPRALFAESYRISGAGTRAAAAPAAPQGFGP